MSENYIRKNYKRYSYPSGNLQSPFSSLCPPGCTLCPSLNRPSLSGLVLFVPLTKGSPSSPERTWTSKFFFMRPLEDTSIVLRRDLDWWKGSFERGR